MEKNHVTKNTYSINDAVHALLSELDEAMDDMEKGNVISEEEMWEELEAIK